MKRTKSFLAAVADMAVAFVAVPAGAASAGTTCDGGLTLTARSLIFPRATKGIFRLHSTGGTSDARTRTRVWFP